MLVEPITTSLIAGALADLASGSAINIYGKIQDKISPEDGEKLEKELVSSIKERIDSKEISESKLIEIIEPIGDYTVESVYHSREEIADDIGQRLSSSDNSIEIHSKSKAQDIARESIDEALEAWIDYISQDGREQQYILEGIWDNEDQLEEIKRQLDVVVENQEHQTRYSKIEVSNHTDPAEEVSKHLESGRPITADIFVDRSEIPENITQSRYLVIGRRGMGKTRTLDHLQSEMLAEHEIDQIIIPNNDFMGVDDALDFSHASLDGNILLVWDDIQGLRSDEQQKTIRQSIVRLSERVKQSGDTLYVVASVRSEFLDEIPNLNRTKDRAWQNFEEIHLKPLDDETVGQLFRKAADAHDPGLDNQERQALIREIQYTDPSPLYVESVVSSINEDQPIADQIDELPSDVQGIWEAQYDRLITEHPDTRFVLWGIDLLRTGGIPLYEPTLRKIYSQVFDRDRFEFQGPTDVLKQKQWIWEADRPIPNTNETIYATRAAQMSAVSEDRMRVIEEYVDFLLNSFAETVPDEDKNWIPTYYTNTAMF